MESSRADGPFEWRGILIDGVPDFGVANAIDPFTLMDDGRIWHFFASGGVFYDGTYHLVVARSRNLGGPYYDREGHLFTEGKAQPILSSREGDHFIGPGHHGDVFTTADGRTYMFFHSHATDFPSGARPTLLQQIFWDSEEWPYFAGGAPAEQETRP